MGGILEKETLGEAVPLPGGELLAARGFLHGAR